jgi:hypothetical protein
LHSRRLIPVFPESAADFFCAVYAAALLIGTVARKDFF